MMGYKDLHDKQAAKSPERSYHVIAVNEKSGGKTRCTKDPVTHKEGCTILSKFSHHPARRMQLEEV